MLALAHSPTFGQTRPRIGPPAPIRSDIDAYRRMAATLGIKPMPWQEVAASYITARDGDGRFQYREVAIVVARQNGKTTLTRPLIVQRLRAGRRIMHIAQVRELPRLMFEAIADGLEETDPDLFPKRRGKIIWPRRQAGAESIQLTNGGGYRIAAAWNGSSRGHSFDDLLIDELREMDSFTVINAAKPAQRFSPDPQTIYLSNAGTDESVILNSLRSRAEAADPNLAYLEWSASPDLADDDFTGWMQANPAIGHYEQVLRDLERDHLAAKLAGNMAGFENEALCRWVPTMRPRLVDDFAWQRCKDLRPPKPARPAIGLGYDPQAKRASIVAAWRDGDRVHLTELFDVAATEGLDLEALGRDALKRAQRMGATAIGYDDATDRDLARQFTGPLAKRTKPLIGKDFQNASEAFVRAIEHGSLAWHDGDHVTSDLRSTSRHENTETGTFHAVKSKQDVPVTASLAAIRAYWLASAKPPTGSLKVM